MKNTIEEETAADKMMLENQNEVIMSPVMYTEITNKEYEKLPLYKLDDLFLSYDEIPDDQKKLNRFRVRFYALRIDPQDPKEVVQAFDKKTMETFSCSDMGDDEEKKAGFMYRMQLLVKDHAS